jgi:hypothetical protein
MKTKKVPKYLLYASIILSLSVILSLGGCKNFGIPDYELEITVEEGVEGTPLPGVYTYRDLTIIDYRYTPANPEYTVEVLVNGTRRLSEGQFIMYTDLDVVARILDIRGTWDFQLTYTPTEGDKEITEFSITFSGDNLLSGNFTDDRGYTGTWNIDGVIITITYTNWQDYVLEGYITTMEGTWESAIEEKDGTWLASRQST